jgi:cytochrome c5
MKKNQRFEDLSNLNSARKRRVSFLSLALPLAIAFILPPASAQFYDRSGKEVVDTVCAACHKEGVEGAPKIGDLQAWVQRISQGMGYAVGSAIRGHGGMPPRGGQANLTDTELRAAILYMYNPAGGPTKPAQPVARAAPLAAPRGADPNHQSVGGIDIHLGFMPAKMLHKLPAGSPERSMHGGIPKGSGYYHVNVSLFEGESRMPITDAKIRMQFQQSGRTSTATDLEPMAISAGSYGNYIKPLPKTPALVILYIARSWSSRTIEAKFEHNFN